MVVDEQVITTGLDEAAIRRIVRSELEKAGSDPASKRAAFIASKGTLDWAYPPLILATAAAAAGLEASIFFTFYGLNIVHKDFERLLKVAAVGNPAMPKPMPIPEMVMGLPGMEHIATRMMKAKFHDQNVAGIAELLEAARELDIRLIACQMTMDVFGYKQEDFIEGVEFGGAATFLADAQNAHITMFV
ncbi:MAG: DsrE/DsrF/DrsH-like family protein [Solirubrobacteraceae bacterium]